MLCEYTLSTAKEDFYNITSQVREAVSKSGIKNGIAVVYCPHTTAGLTINENADPDVVHDLLLGLKKAFPDRTEFRHGEGNSKHQQEGRTRVLKLCDVSMHNFNAAFAQQKC